MKKQFQAKKTFFLLLSCISALFLLNGATLIYRFGFGAPNSSFFFHFFNMENEHNLPSTYSALQLLFAAVLLYNLFKEMRFENAKYKWHWGLLSLAFFYLCMDEAFELHEKSMEPMHRIVETGGALYYGWIIPASICILIMGIVYFKFLFNLPGRTRNLFIAAGIIYVGAAIGFEMIEGPLDQKGQWMSLTYAILVMIEETLEMFGIALFCYAIIDYENRRKEQPEAEPEQLAA